MSRVRFGYGTWHTNPWTGGFLFRLTDTSKRMDKIRKRDIKKQSGYDATKYLKVAIGWYFSIFRGKMDVVTIGQNVTQLGWP